VLDVLTKKGQHMEHFIGVAHKPRLMSRFQERMLEYKRYDRGIPLRLPPPPCCCYFPSSSHLPFSPHLPICSWLRRTFSRGL
jgi:hypothetical protein